MVLIVALIVLVAMTLVGMAVMRSAETGVAVTTNFAFRQQAVQGSDVATRTAVQWLRDNASSLESNNEGVGYFAAWQDTFNPQTHTWAATNSSAEIIDSGTSYRYVIHRLCPSTGAAAGCVSPPGVSGASGGGTGQFYGGGRLSSPAATLFRVTIRAVGPKNTVAYAQTFIR
jgi:type IV pilus assembly protein PilX